MLGSFEAANFIAKLAHAVIPCARHPSASSMLAQ